MFTRARVAILVYFVASFIAPVAAQDLQTLSRDIGGIERGFWTRSVTNDLEIDGDQLVIRRFYNTIVEWIADGVPGRTVTDRLEWRLPLKDLVRVEISSAPGSDLLEGEDQDSYCPLTVARFACSTDLDDCGSTPTFAVCRYNSPELMTMLKTLQSEAPNLTIISVD